MVYILSERVEVETVLIFGVENQCAGRIAATLNTENLDKLISHTYILNLNGS